MFNRHFASPCTPLQNQSSLTTHKFSELRGEKLLFSQNIGEDDIFTIIKNLNLINTMDGIICQSE